jgi:uncharacterized protein
MSVALLDINVLVPLLLDWHPDHNAALRWFDENANGGWATCAITQTAFVRLASNPSFTQRIIPPMQASALLAENLTHPHHRFWTDNIGIHEALSVFSKRISGHKQIPDAYLLALALHNKGHLVTFDKAIASLLPDEKSRSRHVITLSSR